MKTVLLTIAATLAAVAFAASLFLNPILGAFGLTATSIGALQDLHASHRVVERMKQRHAQKKLDAPRKFAQRSAKRVASTALAAATIGTVAVAVTVASLEVANYCDEKRDLQDDANLLYGTDAAFDMDRCIEEGKEESKEILREVQASSAEAVANALAETGKYGAETWRAIREESLAVFQSTADRAVSIWDETLAWWSQGEHSLHQRNPVPAAQR